MVYLTGRTDTAVIVKDPVERAEQRERQRELAEQLKASGALDAIFAQIDAGETPLNNGFTA